MKATLPLSRPQGFVLVVGLCSLGAVGYAAYVAHGRQSVAQAPAARSEPTADPATAAAASGSNRPVLYRSTAPGEGYGQVMLSQPGSAAPSTSAVRATPLRCERVHFAAGHGVCLQSRRGVITTYTARLFNAVFETTGSYALAGPPSRARMSPDGRLAAMTVFVSGHGYSNGDFTTRTSVIDAVTGRAVVDDLEQFSVEKDGAPFKRANFNFWGVSFTQDGRHFYATLGSGDQRYLVRADLAARRMTVLRDAVECPSLSPDNRRIAFKRRVANEAGGRIAWRLAVLDLVSGQVTPLERETHNVDDQVEWLDDAHIVYALPDDATQAGTAASSWVLAVDGASDPQRLLPYAVSPAVLRGP